MAKKETETLSQYVARIMEEKQLKMYDVEVRSGRRITDAYVGNILKGKARNPSVDKLQALAAGLGVDEDEIFRVARGLPLADTGQRRSNDPWPLHLFFKTMERIVSSPELTRIVQALLRASPKELPAILKYIESRQKPKSNGKQA
jgi:transcriptional regulator with XRE-family HTH domain